MTSSLMNDSATPDGMVAAALQALQADGDAAFPVLDALPAPIYTTDGEGRLTYFNPACVAFSGRTPSIGTDSWCVTWKIYTEEGRYLPHDQCPMAVAIREKRAIRDVEAVAERPDGSRVNFRPFPTPLFDAEGNLVGALNLLLDVTAEKQAHYLRAQAERCRRFARSVSDKVTASALSDMAADYDEKAAGLLPN